MKHVSPFTEPVGARTPKFSTNDKSSSFIINSGEGFGLLCLAQGFPVPTFRYVPVVLHTMQWVLPIVLFSGLHLSSLRFFFFFLLNALVYSGLLIFSIFQNDTFPKKNVGEGDDYSTPTKHPSAVHNSRVFRRCTMV